MFLRRSSPQIRPAVRLNRRIFQKYFNEQKIQGTRLILAHFLKMISQLLVERKYFFFFSFLSQLNYSFSLPFFQTFFLSDKLVRLWHRSSTANKFAEISVSPLDFHQYAVNQVDFSLCGTMLASCSVDGTTVIWNLTVYNQLQIMTRKLLHRVFVDFYGVLNISKKYI